MKKNEKYQKIFKKFPKNHPEISDESFKKALFLIFVGWAVIFCFVLNAAKIGWK